MKEILPDQSEEQPPLRSKSALKELEISAMLDEFRENWLVEIEQRQQSESQHEKLMMGEDAAANDCVMDNLR